VYLAWTAIAILAVQNWTLGTLSGHCLATEPKEANCVVSPLSTSTGRQTFATATGLAGRHAAWLARFTRAVARNPNQFRILYRNPKINGSRPPNGKARRQPSPGRLAHDARRTPRPASHARTHVERERFRAENLVDVEDGDERTAGLPHPSPTPSVDSPRRRGELPVSAGRGAAPARWMLLRGRRRGSKQPSPNAQHSSQNRPGRCLVPRIPKAPPTTS
jgi:hypothetical protein